MESWAMSEPMLLLSIILVVILSDLGILALAVGYLWGLDRGYEIGRGNNQRPNRQPDSAGYKRGT